MKHEAGISQASLPKLTSRKEESLRMSKLKLLLLLLVRSADGGVVRSADWAVDAFLGTRTRPNRQHSRHRPAITLPSQVNQLNEHLTNQLVYE